MRETLLVSVSTSLLEELILKKDCHRLAIQLLIMIKLRSDPGHMRFGEAA